MTGPEHYREAERLIESADETVHSPEALTWRFAQAQVHATLAMTAALALGISDQVAPSSIDTDVIAGRLWRGAVT